MVIFHSYVSVPEGISGVIRIHDIQEIGDSRYQASKRDDEQRFLSTWQVMANPQPEGDFEEWKTLAPGLGLLV